MEQFFGTRLCYRLHNRYCSNPGGETRLRLGDCQTFPQSVMPFNKMNVWKKHVSKSAMELFTPRGKESFRNGSVFFSICSSPMCNYNRRLATNRREPYNHFLVAMSGCRYSLYRAPLYSNFCDPELKCPHVYKRNALFILNGCVISTL